MSFRYTFGSPKLTEQQTEKQRIAIQIRRIAQEIAEYVESRNWTYRIEYSSSGSAYVYAMRMDSAFKVRISDHRTHSMSYDLDIGINSKSYIRKVERLIQVSSAYLDYRNTHRKMRDRCSLGRARKEKRRKL